LPVATVVVSDGTLQAATNTDFAQRLRPLNQVYHVWWILKQF